MSENVLNCVASLFCFLCKTFYYLCSADICPSILYWSRLLSRWLACLARLILPDMFVCDVTMVLVCTRRLGWLICNFRKQTISCLAKKILPSLTIKSKQFVPACKILFFLQWRHNVLTNRGFIAQKRVCAPATKRNCNKIENMCAFWLRKQRKICWEK